IFAIRSHTTRRCAASRRAVRPPSVSLCLCGSSDLCASSVPLCLCSLFSLCADPLRDLAWRRLDAADAGLIAGLDLDEQHRGTALGKEARDAVIQRRPILGPPPP